MSEKSAVTKPAVRILGNPDENKRVVHSAEKSIEQSTEEELKKTQTFPIPKGDNVHVFKGGMMGRKEFDRVKSKRKQQRKSRRANR